MKSLFNGVHMVGASEIAHQLEQNIDMVW